MKPVSKRDCVSVNNEGKSGFILWFYHFLDKTFTAKSVNHKNHKTNSQGKKNRLQQSRKPQEMLNKENKNVITEKSTNYLRNILLNDSSFKELDKNKNHEKVESAKKLHHSEQKDTDRSDFKVLCDRSQLL